MFVQTGLILARVATGLIMCIVYYLYSTKDGKPRYVGQTSRTAEGRLDDHLRRAQTGSSSVLSKWIRSNIERGYQIRDDIVDANAVWNHTERQTIAEWRGRGVKLLNILDGGDDTIHKFIARKKDRRTAKRIIHQTVETNVDQDSQPKRRKPGKHPKMDSKKAEQRRLMYGKLGAASDIRSIPLPVTSEK